MGKSKLKVWALDVSNMNAPDYFFRSKEEALTKGREETEGEVSEWCDGLRRVIAEEASFDVWPWTEGEDQIDCYDEGRKNTYHFHRYIVDGVRGEWKEGPLDG
jgi:hypothetical protein